FRGPRQEHWADAAYVLLWGENNRNVRAPGSPWVIAGRYKGQKVVVVGPHPTRLSDETLVVRPGTDRALAMAVGHVLLKEFYLDRPDRKSTRLNSSHVKNSYAVFCLD